MILYSHILISLNGNSEIVIKIGVSTLTVKNVFTRYRQVSFQLYLIIILSIIMIMLVF